MRKVYAIINNGIVENIMVCADNRLDAVKAAHDECIRIDTIETVVEWVKEGEDSLSAEPVIPEYWSKDGESDVYSDPEDETWTYNEPAVDETWTRTVVTERPNINWTYDGDNFAAPQG